MTLPPGAGRRESKAHFGQDCPILGVHGLVLVVREDDDRVALAIKGV